MPTDIGQKARPGRSAMVDARLARARARRRQAEMPDRRERIVVAAARLFADHGYEATSMRAIADAVHVLPGSLYHHFPTKEDILHQILRPCIDVSTVEGERVHHLPIDAEHMLVTSILTRYYQHLDAWEFHQILDHDSKMLRELPEFRYVAAYKEKMFHLQEKAITTGMARGLFDSEIDVYLMIINIARIISSSTTWFKGGVRHSTDTPSIYTLDRVIDFNLGCIMRMLRASSRAGEPVPRFACELMVSSELKARADRRHVGPAGEGALKR